MMMISLVPDDRVVVLLSGHVERGEPILGLDVHAGRVGDQDLHHLRTTNELINELKKNI